MKRVFGDNPIWQFPKCRTISLPKELPAQAHRLAARVLNALPFDYDDISILPPAGRSQKYTAKLAAKLITHLARAFLSYFRKDAMEALLHIRP